MSGRACKAAICCSAVAAKISMIDRLILKKFITDDDLLDEIIATVDAIDSLLDDLIAKIREADD